MFFTVCAIFLIVGCGGSKNDETSDSDEIQNDEDVVDIDDPTNSTDDPTNPTDDPTNPTDDPTNPTDDPTNPTDDPTNPTDDPTNPTDEPTNPTDDPTNPTDNPTDPTDDPTDPENPDSENPDSDDSDPENPDSENPGSDDSDSENPDSDTSEPEIVCTGISLDASTFIPYYENVYIGYVENGVLGDASSDDIIQIEFDGGVAVASYISNNYHCTACTIVAQDNGTEGEKIYFQKNGTINVSEYDPETLEMSAEISATLVAVTINNNSFTPDETDCITIETGVVKAEETADHAIKTCAGITECKKGCDEDEDCIENCFSDISAVARTQYLNLFSTCNDANNCENNYYCLWENCVAEEEICGMRGDTENYNIPYGEVEINGTFTYLHAEGETEILYSHALEAAFVTGNFGNNGTNIIDQDASASLLSYAKIAPFKDVPEEKNITLVQTYKKVDGKSFGPTVHIVTTLREPGAYKLGLSDWEEEARLFVSDTDSEGEKICDHAFGVGTINITAISWTPGETTISVNGTAKLYSYKASPHYGGDISGPKWVACEAR